MRHEIAPILVAFSCLAPAAIAQTFPEAPASETKETIQRFKEVVVPISGMKIFPTARFDIPRPDPALEIESDFGTGFCLDAECEFIVTNYHVAALARPRKIEHENIVHRYFATGPNDRWATSNATSRGRLSYSMGRDLAIFELRHKLRRHHGLSFGLDDLEPGQEVDIYGYPGKGPIDRRRRLTRFPATFKSPTTSGLLAFEFQGWVGRPIRVAGASGGIVVDRKTGEIVGILNGTSPNSRMAVAVPVQTLVDFVTKVQPFLAEKLFPPSAVRGVSPASPDIYPKFVPAHSNAVEHRPQEPPEVQLLREKAQLLTDSIRNFVAVESYSWGSDDKAPDSEADYEVQVVQGRQLFRSHPQGSEYLNEVPFPGWGLSSAMVNPVDEWSQLPKMVGTEFRLKVQQAQDAHLNGRTIKVFQYYASVEDGLCSFVDIDDFLLFTVHHKPLELACFGEVWTDEDTNILRISQREDFDKSKPYHTWRGRDAVVTYGWLDRGSQPRLLVPQTIYVEGRKKSHIYWCRGNFTDYHEFSVGVRFITDAMTESQPSNPH